MVTIQSVICNAIWIVGLAGVLATVSYTDWLRKIHRQSWKVAASTPSFALPFNLSMFLVALGIALSGWQGTPRPPLWETILWVILTMLFLVQAIVAIRSAKADHLSSQ